jgi:chemotaxis-related protein WspD
MKPEPEQPLDTTTDQPTGCSETDAMIRLLDRPLAPIDLVETTARIGQPITPPERQTRSVLAFRLGVEWFAVTTRDVHRVTAPVPVHQIPHRSNAIIRGLCNIEGQLLICGSLRDLLGLTDDTALPAAELPAVKQRAHETQMVVLGEPHDEWVFEVDRVLGVVHVDLRSIQTPPVTIEHARDRYTDSIVSLGEVHAALLSTERLKAGLKAALS